MGQCGGPLRSLSVVFYSSPPSSSLQVDLTMNLNKPEKEREIDKKNYHTTMASKLYFLGMTMYHFLSAMVDGPGYLPLGWKPKEVLMLYQIFLLFE